MEKLPWEYVEIIEQEGKNEGDLLEDFISKYSVEGYILNETVQRFKFKFLFLNFWDKTKKLLDAYLYYKDVNAHLSYYSFFKEILNLKDVNYEMMIKKLNKSFKGKYVFKIKNILHIKDKSILLFIIKDKKKKLFKEQTWASKRWSDYLIISLYKDRIIIKDIARNLNQYDYKKIIGEFLNFLDVEIEPVKPKKVNFLNSVKKIIGVDGIKSMSFISEGFEGSPIIKVIRRKINDDIKETLKKLTEQGHLTTLDNIKDFSIDLSKNNPPLYVKIEHKLSDVDETIRKVTLKFDTTNLTEEDLKVLESKEIKINTLYYEEGKRNLLEDLNKLIYKNQLNSFEEVWYSDLITSLEEYNLIYKERKGINLRINFSLQGFMELLLNYLIQNNFLFKLIPLPSGFGTIREKVSILDVSSKKQHFLMVVFLTSPSQGVIDKFKSKWAFGLSRPPLFIVLKEDLYDQVKLFRDFPHLTFGNILESIIEGNFSEEMSEVINQISEEYRKERIKLANITLKSLREIINKKQSKTRFTEFEEGIFYIVDSLFTASQKISGPYLPDGLKFSPLQDPSEGVFIWDTKIWFTNFKKEEEIQKMRRYILTSLKNDQIIALGGLKKYLFLGHLENPEVIQEMFKEAKKRCLREYKIHRILKKDIERINFAYVDFEFFEKILYWMNKQKESTLGELFFYNKLNDLIKENFFLNLKAANKFIKDLEKKTKEFNKKIDIKNFRKIGKEIKSS